MQSITIIVPTYNDENYLKQCFQSIDAQENKDFRVLFVDDGSQDGSVRLISDYVMTHSNAEAITKENGGYGSSLVAAIQTLVTKYFLICDADDRLQKDAVESLLSLAKRTQSDMVIGARMDQKGITKELTYEAGCDMQYVQLESDTVYHCEDCSFEKLFFVDPSSQSKLYRTSLCKDLQLPGRIVYGDHLLYFHALRKAKRVVYTDKPLAVYRQRRISRSHQIDDKFVGKIQAYRYILETGQADCKANLFYVRMLMEWEKCLQEYCQLESSEAQKQSVGKLLTEYRRLLAIHPVRIRNGLKDLGIPFQERVRHQVMTTTALDRILR